MSKWVSLLGTQIWENERATSKKQTALWNLQWGFEYSYEWALYTGPLLTNKAVCGPILWGPLICLPKFPNNFGASKSTLFIGFRRRGDSFTRSSLRFLIKKVFKADLPHGIFKWSSWIFFKKKSPNLKAYLIFMPFRCLSDGFLRHLWSPSALITSLKWFQRLTNLFPKNCSNAGDFVGKWAS